MQICDASSWWAGAKFRVQGLRFGDGSGAFLRADGGGRVRRQHQAVRRKITHVGQNNHPNSFPDFRWTQHDVPANLGHWFVAVDPEAFETGLKDRVQVCRNSSSFLWDCGWPRLLYVLKHDRILWTPSGPYRRPIRRPLKSRFSSLATRRGTPRRRPGGLASSGTRRTTSQATGGLQRN